MGQRGTDMSKDDLRKAVEQVWDRRIAEVQKDLDYLLNFDLTQAIQEWRAKATSMVLDFADRIGNPDHEVADRELEEFEVPGAPSKPSKWRRQGVEEQLRKLRRSKSDALDFLSAMKVENGYVTVTAYDLRRLGYPSEIRD